MHSRSDVLKFIGKTRPFEKRTKDFQDFPGCHAFDLGFGFAFIFHFWYILQGFLWASKSTGHPLSSLSRWLSRNPNQGSQRGKIFLLWSQNHVEDSQQNLNPRWFWWNSCCLNHIFQKIYNLQVTTAGFAALGVVQWQVENSFQMSFALRISIQGRAG